MTARRAHLIGAILLGSFGLGHMFNHISLFLGLDAHLAYQDIARHLYRTKLVEPLLIAGFAVQVVIGMRLALRRG